VSAAPELVGVSSKVTFAPAIAVSTPVSAFRRNFLINVKSLTEKGSDEPPAQLAESGLKQP
jgi:hypothetical protein